MQTYFQVSLRYEADFGTRTIPSSYWWISDAHRRELNVPHLDRCSSSAVLSLTTKEFFNHVRFLSETAKLGWKWLEYLMEWIYEVFFCLIADQDVRLKTALSAKVEQICGYMWSSSIHSQKHILLIQVGEGTHTGITNNTWRRGGTQGGA